MRINETYEIKQTYKIEKNVPIPEITKNGKWKSLIERMEVSDSVVVYKKNELTALRTALARSGFGNVHRDLGDGKYRVWKVEKK